MRKYLDEWIMLRQFALAHWYAIDNDHLIELQHWDYEFQRVALL